MVVFLVPIVTAGAIAIALAVRAGPESARVTTTLLLALAGLAIVLVLPSLVLAGPMLVLEGLRPVDALWRSFDLQRRGYWRLVVRVICTYLIVVAVSTVVGLPFSLAASQARPHGDVSAQSLASLILGSVGWVFGQIATLPFLIVTNAQLYTDQLVRCADADTT